MRIAFASCMFSDAFPVQPVWSWIAAQAPDRLVLLGDSTYFDINTSPHPENMNDFQFAQHAYQRYVDTLSQPEFSALVRAMPNNTVHAIWDDHDFLWNDALGAEVHPVHSEKVRLSTALHEAFRTALSNQLAAGSFPGSYNDPSLWNLQQPPLSTPSIQLAPDVWLHLSDGRTYRTRTFALRESRRTIFGKPQLDKFSQAIQGAPEALHLWASSSTIAGYQRYARDLHWLRTMAGSQRVLVLSGDIHRNEIDAFYINPRALALHEATSSGAAVRDAVVVGSALQNYGLVDIGPEQVSIQLFSRNRLQQQRVLDRQTWLPA